jgi:hypothetical protein
VKHQGAFIPQLLESGEPLLDVLPYSHFKDLGKDSSVASKKILELATFAQAQKVLIGRNIGRGILVIEDPIIQSLGMKSRRSDLLEALKVLAERILNTLPGNWRVDAQDRQENGGMMAIYLFRGDKS